MSTSPRSIFRGTAYGLIAAALISAIPTILDWRSNPGEIFRNQSGTDWEIVWATWISWFWPLVLLLVPLAVLIHVFWLARCVDKAEE